MRARKIRLGHEVDLPSLRTSRETHLRFATGTELEIWASWLELRFSGGLLDRGMNSAKLAATLLLITVLCDSHHRGAVVNAIVSIISIRGRFRAG